MLHSSVPPQRVTLKSSLRAFRQACADLRADIDRYVYMDHCHWLVAFLGRQGIWVMTQYRVSRWVHFYFHIPVLRPLLKLLCGIWQKVIEIVTGVELPNRAEIGGGLFMPHANGIIIHIDAKLGRNCNLSQQVTIGVGGREDRGTPQIGDRVFFGPGAKIFGPITIGHDVAIGANAVVLRDLPHQAVAVGIPAKVISYDGSQDFILYRGCAMNSPDASRRPRVEPDAAPMSESDPDYIAEFNANNPRS
ncbi:serine acetyltransferase [filamentous cyanobacterium LEGE 11480]|uniref:Serine acetyltransferase n=1 Tax=Romeriopsis navalis LEGE 11480 TaxID=2777977 RepID=A0A928VPC4_9CYAN|nr:serine O-acetyltransferase [Romeriopsis navalis]MBE9030416.1 serine acetyltransferase [Romeriopsis navalis LEGE 11480]